MRYVIGMLVALALTGAMAAACGPAYPSDQASVNDPSSPSPIAQTEAQVEPPPSPAPTPTATPVPIRTLRDILRTTLFLPGMEWSWDFPSLKQSSTLEQHHKYGDFHTGHFDGGYIAFPMDDPAYVELIVGLDVHAMVLGTVLKALGYDQRYALPHSDAAQSLEASRAGAPAPWGACALPDGALIGTNVRLGWNAVSALNYRYFKTVVGHYSNQDEELAPCETGFPLEEIVSRLELYGKALPDEPQPYALWQEGRRYSEYDECYWYWAEIYNYDERARVCLDRNNIELIGEVRRPATDEERAAQNEAAATAIAEQDAEREKSKRAAAEPQIKLCARINGISEAECWRQWEEQEGLQ